MDNKELIQAIYKILLLFEDVNDNDSNVTEQDYISYLQRISIRFLGRSQDEICDIIQGLIKSEMNIEQKKVKSIVFHMISLLNRGEANGT